MKIALLGSHKILQNADWEPLTQNAAFILKGKQPIRNHLHELITLKYKSNTIFQHSGTSQQAARCHITNDLNLQQQHCLKPNLAHTSTACTGNKTSISNDQMFTQIMKTSFMYFIWIYAAGLCIKMMNEITADGCQSDHGQPQTRTSEERTKGADADTTTKYTEVHGTRKQYDIKKVRMFDSYMMIIKYCFITNSVSHEHHLRQNTTSEYCKYTHKFLTALVN